MRSAMSGILAIMALAAPACAQTETTKGAAVDSASVARLLGSGSAWKTDFSRISVDPGEIVSGGPPKDGIPSVDSPSFESVDEADRWLDEREPVMVVEHGAVVKAYPLQILIWHEIVNDEVGGRPLTVTYCPLCNTALVFERRHGDRVLDFGTTGSLRQSDLVMYDRQTESWWQQASGEAIVGELTGELLDFYPANTLAWGQAKRLYPELRVLSRDTGHGRSYGRNPYAGYDTQSRPIRGFFQGDIDDRWPAMERVAGIPRGAGWAVTFADLSESRVANGEVDGIAVVAFWAPGAASALDRSAIADGRDVGQSVTFERALAERTLSFEWRDDGFHDLETGSRWDLAGRAVAGPLSGKRLTPIEHGNYLWFAWSSFMPDSEVWKRD